MVRVRVGEPVDCNKCGGRESVFLLATPDGLWSMCLLCKFREREWKFGDSREYLSYLAGKFKCTEDEIRRALEVALNLPEYFKFFLRLVK
jgi:hypothetical protein